MQIKLFDTEVVNIKSMSKSELTTAYGVCRHTLRAWLNKVPNLDQKKKKIFSPLEVSLIFKHLGNP